MSMVIRGADVYTKHHQFQTKDIYIEGERIVREPAGGDKDAGQVVDGTGLYAIPGLVDIHFHGAVGHDFCDADEEGFREIAEYEASCGVLAICPATMAFDEEHLGRIMDMAAGYRSVSGADFVGINMEGPFISADRIGAQNPAYIVKPDAKMFERLQKRSGNRIKLVDIAPETKGAMAFIRRLHSEVTISLAHTAADYETAAQAFAAGASHLTHMYDAMPDLGHRQPGPIAAAAEHGADAELICDGVHVHPAMARLAFRIFGPERIILISDSMMACGLADGRYTLGGQEVNVRGAVATLSKRADTIAGSVTDLFGCMRKAVLDMGIPLEDAVRAATENPARSVGVGADYGSLEDGRFANVLLVDNEMRIHKIIQRGRILRM